MDAALEIFCSRIREHSAKTARIKHRRVRTLMHGNGIIEWADGAAVVKGDVDGSVELLIEGSRIPAEWYLEVTKSLKEIGVERMHLESWAWWLGEGEENPGKIRIIDHVACHLSNPLTGSEAARRGEAFISMRGAYDRDDKGAKGGKRSARPAEAVLWHTDETERLSDEEVKTAMEAGCTIAGPNVASWAVCAVAAGMRFSAEAETAG